jgi:hypothetical protein
VQELRKRLEQQRRSLRRGKAETTSMVGR